MDGPCAKVNLVLSEAPRWTACRPTPTSNRRAFATLVPTLEQAERIYDIAKWGEIPEELWVDCVVASNVDPTLAPPGVHIMTCFVQYVPYRLRVGTWDDQRDLLGKRVLDIVGRYAPNAPGAVQAMQVLTPLDLERTYGLTEGNIFHGDLNIQQLFFMRPVPGLGRLPHADRGPVPLRRRRAPGRRRHRRARLRRGAPAAARRRPGRGAAAPVSLRIPCPRCGVRPSEEFTFGGELRPLEAEDPRRGLRARLPARERGGRAGPSGGSTRSGAGAGSP